jgi:hypothetical protein
VLTSDLVVTVSAAGRPAAGATVRISGAVMNQARADGSGTVTFPGIPAGAYQISVSAAGCNPGTGAATTVAGQVTAASVTLTRILTIRSQTVQTAPADRARTRIGVGEEVQLTASTAASWSVSGGGTLSATSGTSVVFRAGAQADRATITATAAGSSGSIRLDILEPTFRMEVAFGVKHTHGRPDCGFLTQMFLLPADVSFVHVDVREMNSACRADGFYAPFNGSTHQPKEMASSEAFVVRAPGADTKGSSPDLFDQVYSGDPGGAIIEGRLTHDIVWEFRVRGGSFAPMPQKTQSHVVDAAGNCTTSKAGATATRAPNAPTSDWLPTS